MTLGVEDRLDDQFTQTSIYMRPVTSRINRTNTISPRVPLGAYPQLRLCGQAGTAPISINTTMTSRIVIMNSSSQWVSSGGSLGERVSIKRLMAERAQFHFVG